MRRAVPGGDSQPAVRVVDLLPAGAAADVREHLPPGGLQVGGQGGHSSTQAGHVHPRPLLPRQGPRLQERHGVGEAQVV